MSAEKIKNSAASLFAEHGYAGTSLAQISEQVGIKKPSIYAHFKSKEHLFSALLDDAFASELRILYGQSSLFELLNNYVKRHANDALFRFLITSSFFPPDHLKEDILNRYYDYLDAMEKKTGEILQDGIEAGTIRNIDIADTAAMYTIILDSILVELCYGSRERTEKRLDVSWRFFWNSIRKGEKEHD
ncbi:TetR/AcrR family transcriptional regulator [Domibacillus mangrovi]|uniref:HTH tetR-type domain-containing protein n=1 Tax=Domibacillus mangrovi TaxID=1714354 RepID=A0A1Q5P1D8_9BACI|nr:TetR/AcrR family transcriptional regulator [Domibacillus mangrovi]OKL36069.1 hypothetical protein BLL40_12125 [Domibacillus mangrovi]